MTAHRSIVPVAFLSWILSLPGAFAADAAPGPAVAAAQPAGIVLEDFQGNPRRLEEFTGAGTWLIVMIWASDCHICNAEVPEYMAFHETHKDTDASVLGISMDGKSRMEAAQQFIDRHLVNFPSLIGEPAAVTELYRRLTGTFLAGTPAFLVYTPAGELAAKQIGAVPVKLIEEFIHAKAAPANKG